MDVVSKPASEPIEWEATSPNNIFRHAIASGLLRAIVQKKVCSDGMSDIVYGLSVELLSTDAERPVIMSGCCSIGQ